MNNPIDPETKSEITMEEFRNRIFSLAADIRYWDYDKLKEEMCRLLSDNEKFSDFVKMEDLDDISPTKDWLLKSVIRLVQRELYEKYSVEIPDRVNTSDVNFFKMNISLQKEDENSEEDFDDADNEENSNDVDSNETNNDEVESDDSCDESDEEINEESDNKENEIEQDEEIKETPKKNIANNKEIIELKNELINYIDETLEKIKEDLHKKILVKISEISINNAVINKEEFEDNKIERKPKIERKSKKIERKGSRGRKKINYNITCLVDEMPEELSGNLYKSNLFISILNDKKITRKEWFSNTLNILLDGEEENEDVKIKLQKDFNFIVKNEFEKKGWVKIEE